MLMPDYGTVQFLYQDRLREAAKHLRPLVLTFDEAEQPAAQPAKGLLSLLKARFGARRRQPRREALASR